jgi:hypothetical protein
MCLQQQNAASRRPTIQQSKKSVRRATWRLTKTVNSRYCSAITKKANIENMFCARVVIARISSRDCISDLATFLGFLSCHPAKGNKDMTAVLFSVLIVGFIV